MSFLGVGAGGAPGGMNPNDPNDAFMKTMKTMMDSCYTKTAMSGVMGFGLGGFIGMFMASMSYDTPFHTAPGGGQTPISSLPLRKQLAVGFRDMGSRSWSSAKNFGKVGAVFSGIECGIEGLRAKNDMANGAVAGCLTGAILAHGAGPQATAVGCAGFAAFSTAIEVWMRMPKEED